MNRRLAVLAIALYSSGVGAGQFRQQGTKPRSMFFEETSRCRADDIGHLEGWPAHLAWFLRKTGMPAALETGRESSGFAAACRCRCERCR